jgi:hypothetical protein
MSSRRQQSLAKTESAGRDGHLAESDSATDETSKGQTVPKDIFGISGM